MAARLATGRPRSQRSLPLHGPRKSPRRFLPWQELPASVKRLGEISRLAPSNLLGLAAAGLILAAAPVLAGEGIAAEERVSAEGSAVARAPAEARESIAYVQAAILAPADDAALRDNTGNVQVRGQVAPALAAGHQVQLLLDGAPWGSPQGTAEFSLANLDRGTHSLALRILDGEGKLLFAGPPSVFHLLRHSRLHPKPNPR